MMEKIKREVFTAEELAKIFGVTRKTIYQNAKQGNIPTIRLGRRLFFPKRAVFQWLKTTKLPSSKVGNLLDTQESSRLIPLPFEKE